jgi:hypothetical protein
VYPSTREAPKARMRSSPDTDGVSFSPGSAMIGEVNGEWGMGSGELGGCACIKSVSYSMMEYSTVQ